MGRVRHRGPDAEGIHHTGLGTLGHTRLSIMDIVGGNQPIHDQRGGRSIVANGEIYNFAQLRATLTDQRFQTESDSEPILYLYDQFGPDTAAQLDGMFAFAIADGEHLFVARDPVGIKPLYYGQRGNAWAFASELKALVGLVDEVREFPPGHCFHTARGFRRYRSLPNESPQDASIDHHAGRVRGALENAVEKRLMSDVEVGAFLSGGLDSSLIAAIARSRLNRLHTFSVGIEGSRDLEAARMVSQYLDTIHHEYAFTADEAARLLPEIVWSLESYDQDLVRSAVPCYFVSRLAADHCKVILTGEGADELFAGYTYYHDWPADSLHAELHRSIHSLHNINLQRVDRLTMHHSIEGRVPFLDLNMIETAQTVPIDLKLRDVGKHRRVEKWILRKACEDLLPRDIVWRIKEQFDEGSGSVDILADTCRAVMPPDLAGTYIAEHADAKLRSAEEAAYHKLLHQAYEGSSVVMNNVSRWADRPVTAA